MKTCPFCAEQVQDEAVKCRHCHESLQGDAAKWQEFRRRYIAMSPDEQARAWNDLSPQQRVAFEPVLAGKSLSAPRPEPKKSDVVAFFLGLFLGPVGLWYKGHWMAGFAWLAMGILGLLATAGFAAPLFWIGMAIHAAVAKPVT